MNYILFDLDGTLTDPKVGITSAVAYALNLEGIQVDTLDDLCFFIGPPLKASFMESYHFSEEQAERAIKNYRVYFEKQGMLENVVYHSILELCESLCKEGKQLLVATSKPTVYAKQIVKHFQLEPYFLEVYGSELDGTRSLKGEVIAYAMTKHHIDPKDCIMVGDRKHDIIGAHENDIPSIGVLYGYGDYQELSDANATWIVNDVKELKDLLSKDN